MKDRLKNNLGLKIMAVLFAVFLWWAVVNVDNPVVTGKYIVEVSVTNPEVITNAGKSYQIIDDTKQVTVTVKARRKILDEIKTKNIIATADLREMQDTSVPIRITIDGFEGKYEDATANPQNIQVKTENTQKKTFPITAVSTGATRDGYVVASMTTSPQTVDISGPESSIAKISKVVAKVDVSELAEDMTAQTELLYYDAANNLIDKTLLTSNCDKNGVSVNVKVWKTKDVKLNFDTSAIKPAEGYFFDSIEVEPQTVEVAGTSEILSQLVRLDISSSALAIEGVAENTEVIVDITKYMPENVILADENSNNVVVRIIVEEAGTKSILLPAGSITVANASEDLQLTYETLEVQLKFSGASDVLAELTSDKIIATIDLTEYTNEGTYDIPVKITELPEKCTYIEEVTVRIVLSKKESNN